MVHAGRTGELPANGRQLDRLAFAACGFAFARRRANAKPQAAMGSCKNREKTGNFSIF